MFIFLCKQNVKNSDPKASNKNYITGSSKLNTLNSNCIKHITSMLFYLWSTKCARICAQMTGEFLSLLILQ